MPTIIPVERRVPNTPSLPQTLAPCGSAWLHAGFCNTKNAQRSVGSEKGAPTLSLVAAGLRTPKKTAKVSASTSNMHHVMGVPTNVANNNWDPNDEARRLVQEMSVKAPSRSAAAPHVHARVLRTAPSSEWDCRFKRPARMLRRRSQYVAVESSKWVRIANPVARPGSTASRAQHCDGLLLSVPLQHERLAKVSAQLWFAMSICCSNLSMMQ